MSEIRHPGDTEPAEPPPPEAPPPDPTAWFDRIVAAKLQAEAATPAAEEAPAESATPRADALRARPPDSFAPVAWNRICDGIAFDEFQRQVYLDRGGANEIALDNGKRLDSYIPGEEIVSRKHTQLAEVQPSTAIDYLQEMNRKYSVRETVADTTAGNTSFHDGGARHASQLLPAVELPAPPADRPADRAAGQEA